MSDIFTHAENFHIIGYLDTEYETAINALTFLFGLRSTEATVQANAAL